MNQTPNPIKFNLKVTPSLWTHLGTSTVRLDANGDLIDREEYYPFGDSSLRTTELKRYRYVGKEKDSESGLYYYGARYYSAWTCRFISVDPLAGDYPHLNPFNYAGNKPIGDLDIDGLQGTGDEPVKKGDTIIGDDGKQYTMSADQINITGYKRNSFVTNLVTSDTLSFPTTSTFSSLDDSNYEFWTDMLVWEKSEEYKTVFDQADKGRILDEQEMDWASSDALNTDFYSLRIDKLPEGYSSEKELFSYVRKNFSSFFKGNWTTLTPHFDSSSEDLWNSNNPTGAIMTFHSWSVFGNSYLSFDDAAVLTTQSSENHWVFTPVGTGWDWEHPLAGHREFGISSNKDGSYSFYSRAVDLLWDVEDALLGETFYNQADKMWKRVFNNISNYINENGGSSSMTHSFSRRINWSVINDKHK